MPILDPISELTLALSCIPKPIQWLILQDEIPDCNLAGMSRDETALRECAAEFAAVSKRIHAEAAATPASNQQISETQLAFADTAEQLSQWLFSLADQMGLTRTEFEKMIGETITFALMTFYQILILAPGPVTSPLAWWKAAAAHKKYLAMRNALIAKTAEHGAKGVVQRAALHITVPALGWATITGGIDLSWQGLQILTEDRDRVDWKTVGTFAAMGAGAVAGAHVGTAAAARALPHIPARVTVPVNPSRLGIPRLGRYEIPIATATIAKYSLPIIGSSAGVIAGAGVAYPLTGHFEWHELLPGLVGGSAIALASTRVAGLQTIDGKPPTVPIDVPVPPVPDVNIIRRPDPGAEVRTWEPAHQRERLLDKIPEQLKNRIPGQLRNIISERTVLPTTSGIKAEKALGRLLQAEGWHDPLHRDVISELTGKAYTEGLRYGPGEVKLKVESVTYPDSPGKPRMLTVELSESGGVPHLRTGETVESKVPPAREALSQLADRHNVTRHPDGRTVRKFQFDENPDRLLGQRASTAHGETASPPKIPDQNMGAADNLVNQYIDVDPGDHVLDLPTDHLLTTEEFLDLPHVREVLDRAREKILLDDGRKVTVGEGIRILLQENPKLTKLMQETRIEGWDISSDLLSYPRTWVNWLKNPEAVDLMENTMKAMLSEEGRESVRKEIEGAKPSEFPLTPDQRQKLDEKSREASALPEDAWRQPIKVEEWRHPLKPLLGRSRHVDKLFRNWQIRQLTGKWEEVQKGLMDPLFGDLESWGATHYEGRSWHKPFERIGLKLLGDRKIHNDPTLLYDIYAGLLRYDTLDQLMVGVDKVYAHPDLQVVGFDNRMTRRDPTEAEIAERRAAGDEPADRPIGGPQRSGFGDLRFKLKIKAPGAESFEGASVIELELKLTDTADAERIDHPLLELQRIIDSRGKENRTDAEELILGHMQYQTQDLWRRTVKATLAQSEAHIEPEVVAAKWLSGVRKFGERFKTRRQSPDGET